MTDEEKRMLDLAGARWNYAGSLEQLVRDEFDISLTRFWQRVSQLCETREALEYAPATVNRLRRIRETREVSRASRR
ncbi:helix-turn-helix DNA binding domain protein [Gordonia phage Floral]|nr:helix-turn-helix DNA-binding protein [Gordonia phage Pollux]QZD97170.1 helix-turn-helix DNA binding domain protein [Gordonia phage Floral]